MYCSPLTNNPVKHRVLTLTWGSFRAWPPCPWGKHSADSLLSTKLSQSQCRLSPGSLGVTVETCHTLPVKTWCSNGGQTPTQQAAQLDHCVPHAPQRKQRNATAVPVIKIKAAASSTFTTSLKICILMWARKKKKRMEKIIMSETLYRFWGRLLTSGAPVFWIRGLPLIGVTLKLWAVVKPPRRCLQRETGG